MKRKYKIIKESDGNGVTHYELWYAHKFLWGERWTSVKERSFRYAVTKKWTNEPAIYDWIRSQEIHRTVLKEFEL